jgi:hypothetical protein
VAGNEERLIVQRLDDELLVYDTASDEAHCLSGGAAAEFASAPDEVSRREVIRKLALGGAALTIPLVMSIKVPPASAQASATCQAGGNACTTSAQCTSGCCCQALINICISGTAPGQTPAQCCASLPGAGGATPTCA